MPGLMDLEIRSATDLSKKTRDILDTATAGMVIIHREKPKSDIAMLRHETLKIMAVAHHLTPQVISIARYVTTVESESRLSIGPPADLDWLSVYDSDDLRDFSTEYFGVASRVLQGDLPMSAIEDLLTQWRRSAEVLQDDALRQRLQRERSLILEGS